MATTVIENLVTRFTFDFDRKKLMQFDASFKGILKGLTAFKAAVDASAGAVFLFTERIAGSNDALFKLSQRLGIGVDALQEMGYVAELNGGSVDSMNSALENLSRIASQAARGVGDGVEVFGMLGLSATDAAGNIKEADDLMLEIADSVARLGTQAERLEFTQRLGIGPDLLLALQQGSAAIREQREEARQLGLAVDEDAGTAAANFNDAMLRMVTILKSVVSVIGTRLMKVITPMIDAFNEWFQINRELIQQRLGDFLQGIVRVSNATTNILIRLWRTVEGLTRIMGGWKNTIAIVGTALLALNAKALLVPVLITAAAAALFLLIEDVVKFAEGGDSAIGELVKDSANLEAALRTLIWLFKQVGEGWKLIFTQGEEALEGFVMFVRDKVKEIRDLFLSIPGLSAALNVVAGGGVSTQIPASQIPGLREAAAQFVTGGGGATTNTNTSNTTGNVTINVNGGNTAELINVLDNYFGTLLQGAQDNFSSQVEN